MDHADHHGHHGHEQGGHMTELDAFMSSLEENATAAAKAVVDAVTGPSAHDHHAHHVHGKEHHGHHTTMGGHDGHSSHDDHNMMMYFHGGCREVILFDFWRVSTWSGLFFSCILIFFMGAAYEGVKWFRVYLQLQQSASQKCPKENGVHLQESIPLHCQQKRSASTEEVYNPTTTPPSAARTHVKRSSPFSSNSPLALPRLLQAALYILQLVLAYWLMLVAMTYNTYLTAAVILGAGFGHWLFAVLKFRNPLGETADSFATDACH